jgi:hypothetical protein
MSRFQINRWWGELERRGGVTHRAGLGWHSLRRRFVTDLRAAPLVDLCRASGWRSPQMVLTVYAQPEDEAVRSLLLGRTAVA